MIKSMFESVPHKLPKYNFDKPIKLLEFKEPKFELIFYSSILTILVIIILSLLCIHDGQFKIDFVLWRVLIAMPLIIITIFIKQLLDELKKYPKELIKKNIWTIEELMQLTKKDKKETENIISHVLEACFKVDDENLKEL